LQAVRAIEQKLFEQNVASPRDFDGLEALVDSDCSEVIEFPQQVDSSNHRNARKMKVNWKALV
jgi:hypothetical protein